MKIALPLCILFLLSMSCGFCQTVGELNAQAIKEFQAGKYEEARSIFETVLLTEPNNVQAKNFMKLILERTKGTQATRKIYDALILPVVDLRDVTLKSAVEYLSQQAVKQSGGKVTPNFVWLVSQETAETMKVTLRLDNVPFSEGLRYIGDMTGVRFVVEEHGIKVMPQTAETPAAK